MTLFLVSSCLDAPRGGIPYDLRLRQTHETIASIWAASMNQGFPAHIVLVDSSINPIPESDEKGFYQLGVNALVKVTSERAKAFAKWHMNSAGEALSIKEALIQISDNSETKKYLTGRVIKISGRYKLNSDFNVTEHEHPGEYCFKTHPSWKNDGTYLYITRLWSMCPTLVPDFLNSCDDILHSCTNEMIDLEHSMWKHLQDKPTTLLQTLGVEGNVAPNGTFVND